MSLSTLQRLRTARDEMPASAVELEGLTKSMPARGGQPPKRRWTGSTSSSRAARSSRLLGPNGAGKSTLINILAGLW